MWCARIRPLADPLADPLANPSADPLQVISAPISLNQIREQVDGGNYETLPEFASDLARMLDNAKAYNVAGSQVSV